MKKRKYESPQTSYVEVEIEGIICGSVFEPGKNDTQDGLTIEKHGFASEDPNQAWEGDYSKEGWD